MRAARAEDHRRHLRERAATWKFQLRRFAFDGIPSLGQAEFSFSSPLTVICGPNGVGKTTILRALGATAAALDGQADPIAAHKLPSGSASLDFLFDGESHQSVATFASGRPSGGTAAGVDVIHIDASSSLPMAQQHFCEFENVAELTNGVGPKDLSEKDLAVLNYLAKRRYDEVRLYEVEGKDNENLPFFEVALRGAKYDSRTMGAGEFTIFFLWWALTVRATENALILIEEPECHLSPGSQAALCDVLVSTAVAKKLVIVITTHSSKIISKVEDNSLVFVYRGEKGVEFVSGKPSPALLETVGIEPRVDTVILVEDEAATEFGKALLEIFRPDLARRTEFVDQHGDGNIIGALRASSRIKNIKIFGLFDGDVRNSTPDDVKDRSTYLPGDKPLEKIFRDMIEADAEAIGSYLGKSDLKEILFGLDGDDHHDWYEGLCRNLGQSRRQLFPTLIRFWLRQEENAVAAQRLVQDLAKRYTR